MKKAVVFAWLVVGVLMGCSASQTVVQNAEPQRAELVFMHKTQLDDSNPFARESELPYGIVDFSKVRVEHYLPAIEAGMAQELEEIEQIANQTDDPTFENTMVPLEKSGALFSRVYPYFSNAAGSCTNDEIKSIQKSLAPRLAALSDTIHLNEKLFGRIHALYEKRETLGLDIESVRLIEEYEREFVRGGAMLSAEKKERFKAINEELASLTTQYGQNILSEMNDSAVVVEDASELDGLSEAQIQSAKALAAERGMEGKYLIALTNTSIQPVLKTMKNRELRKRVHDASVTRGMRSNGADNRENAVKILALRAERARLLGFNSYAEFSVEDKVAGTVDAVNQMQKSMIAPARASYEREKAELQALADSHNAGIAIDDHDWFYYSEQLRKQKYDLDDAALKPYFELNHVIRDGVFYVAGQLYGVTFKERPDIPVYDPDVKVFEVFDADGTPLALFVGDYYARSSKRGGAWKSDFAVQSALTGKKPIVINQINIAKPSEGEPTLLTFDEVTTVFHEFGHALHAMFSDVKYPRFGGTRVPRDFVEFPSQFNEIWAVWPEILQNYAVHYRTGEKLPTELVDKVIAAGQFNQGYMTMEHLAAAVLDQKWHQLSLEEIQKLDAAKLLETEKELLSQAGLDAVVPRYRTAYFNHIFVSGYEAGYYSYMWAEVLDADAEAWFKEHGLSRETGDRLRKHVLSKGYSDDSMKLYRAFAGRDPSSEPLLIRRGLK